MSDAVTLLRLETVDALGEMVAFARMRAEQCAGMKRDAFNTLAEGLETTQKRRLDELVGAEVTQ